MRPIVVTTDAVLCFLFRSSGTSFRVSILLFAVKGGRQS
jgi:hypothetical protein